MSKQEKLPSIAAARKVISSKTSEFESQLMKAKNAFERVCIFNDMQELIDAEIYAWVTTIETMDSEQDQINTQLYNEATTHVANLQEFISTLNNYRASEMDAALKIQQAMLNTHQLSSPKIQKPD
jgi:hypothetical protein